MTIGGLTLVIFFIIGLNPLRLVKGKDDKSLDLRLIIGMILGIVASFFMSLSAWFPLDTMHDAHTMAGILFFIPLALSIILYSWYFISYTDLTNKLWLYFIAFLLAIFELMIFSKEISSVLGPLQIIGLVLFLVGLFIVAILSLWYILRNKGSLSDRFLKTSEYLSYIVSVFIILDFIITTAFLFYSHEFKAVYEVAIVWPFLLWASINNMRALNLSFQTK